jgi:hypothetical protein
MRMRERPVKPVLHALWGRIIVATKFCLTHVLIIFFLGLFEGQAVLEKYAYVVGTDESAIQSN